MLAEDELTPNAAAANGLRAPRPGDSSGQSDGAGVGRGGAGVVRPHVRGGCTRRCLAPEGAGVLSPLGSRAGTWTAHVLAKPLLGDAGVAADVAPGPSRVLVRVPAVVVVAGA